MPRARSGSLAGLCRSLAIGGLIAVVAVFGIEVAVHSVHHLDEPEPISVCAVFAASLDAEGTCPVVAVLVPPAWRVEGDLPAQDAPSRLLSTTSTRSSRAPPLGPVA